MLPPTTTTGTSMSASVRSLIVTSRSCLRSRSWTSTVRARPLRRATGGGRRGHFEEGHPPMSTSRGTVGTQASNKRVRVFFGGEQIVDTDNALYVWENPSYP